MRELVLLDAVRRDRKLRYLETMLMTSAITLSISKSNEAIQQYTDLLEEYNSLIFGIKVDTKNSKESMHEELQKLIGSRGKAAEIIIDNSGTQYTGDLNSVSLETLIKQTRE